LALSRLHAIGACKIDDEYLENNEISAALLSEFRSPHYQVLAPDQLITRSNKGESRH